MPEIVTEPAALDARWLTEALREAGVLTTGRVAEVAWRIIGHGKMGDNVRYQLTYADAPDTAPRSVVAKLPAADPTARAAGAAQGLYWREVCFYREIAPRIPMRTPHVHFSLIDANLTDFVLLMEDMAPAEPGDQIEGCGPDVAELALREAAKLHAPLFDDATVREADWVVQATPEGAELGQAIFRQMWPPFLERFERVMTAEGRSIGDRFAEGFAKWALGYDGPRTLAHGDYRLENMLLASSAGGPPIAVVDWQSVQCGCPLVDVAYFLGGGLSVADRRAHEAELVESYRRELAAREVDLSREDCWRFYRRSAVHGIFITVLGCMLSSQDERGDRMFAAMIERHLQHAVDMECGEFLV